MELKLNNIKKMRLERKIGQEELAKMMGLTRQNIYYIELGKTAITAENQKKFCEIFKCSIDDLYSENPISSIKKSNMIPIKYYDIKASAGNGCFVNNENFENINIDELQLKKMGITSSFKDIVIINAQGNSMLPTIQDGDLLFVNTNKKELYNDKIYIINEDSYLKVKRIIKKSPFDTKIIIKSDNQVSGEYPPYEVELDKINNNFICGQVIFYCRSIE